MVNTEKIKMRLTELGLTQRDVAKALKIKQPTANQKINNIRGMSLPEAEALSKLLGIKDDDFGSYFFKN